ncbi:MAG: hypothetical protein M1820_003559 [Bogoriella megaspora]|nr:MAG: hypothetical protein M1820_003559 [Bogoriella megaspora]
MRQTSLADDFEDQIEDIGKSMASDKDKPTGRPSNGAASTKSTKGHEDEKIGGIGVLDILRVLGGVLLLNSVLSYFVTGDSVLWGYRPWWTRIGPLRTRLGGGISLTDAELLAYDGSDPTKPIYLALNGTIYDVSAGPKFYGPGGGYHFFAGKDAARAFVTGCFDTDLTPDLRGVEEMYIPIDPTEEVAGDSADAKALHDDSKGAEVEGADGELRRKGGKDGPNKAGGKRKKGSRTKKETEEAKQKVRDVIEGWGKMFRGEKGKKEYFEVGKVKREPGWLERLPKRELCERAAKVRPTREVK